MGIGDALIIVVAVGGTPVDTEDAPVDVSSLVGTPVGTGDVPMDAPLGLILGMTGVSLIVEGNDHCIVDLVDGKV